MGILNIQNPHSFVIIDVDIDKVFGSDGAVAAWLPTR